MRSFRMVAFVAVMFGEKALCRAIHDGASTSIVSASPSISPSSTDARPTVSFASSSSSPSSSPSSSTTRAQSQITTCSPASTITTTITTTVTATAPISTTLSGTRGKETTTQSPTPQPASGNTTAQIVGIAIGCSTIIGIVAAIFFFAGHRSSRRRRPSMHNVAPNLESFRTRLDKCWKKYSNRNAHSRHGPATPAELGTTAEVREVSLRPERPVNNQPYFYHPVTVASSLAGELDGSSIMSFNPPPPARLQPQRVEILPVELPTSDDPGNSPLPEYEELDAARRYRIFSWAAPEATYRPDKFAPSSMI